MGALWYDDNRDRYADAPRVFSAEERAEMAAHREAESKRRAEVSERCHAEFADQCEARAFPLVDGLIENRARRIARNPGLLYSIPTLTPYLPASVLYARAEAALEQSQRGDLRWRGFGAESPEITLKAVMRYATEMAANETMVAAE